MDVEADDVIASYAFAYGKEMQVVIASWDSDFFQLFQKRCRFFGIAENARPSVIRHILGTNFKLRRINMQILRLLWEILQIILKAQK